MMLFNREGDSSHERICPIDPERASIIAPIHRLPPEILSRIFLSMLEPQDSDSPQRNELFSTEMKRVLMLVTRQWHSIVQRGPEFWTACAFHLDEQDHDHAEKIKSLLAHSGTLPLQIVLDIPAGSSLVDIWNERLASEEGILSRTETVWLNPPDWNDPPDVTSKYESLHVLETATNLTQLFMFQIEVYPNDLVWGLEEMPGVLHFPALQSVRISASSLPNIRAPCLRILQIDGLARVLNVLLWNVIINAPLLRKINIEGVYMASSVMVTEKELLTLIPPRSFLRHLRSLKFFVFLESLRDRGTDLEFQTALFRVSHSSSLQRIDLNDMAPFGEYVDHKYRLDSLLVPGLKDLTCLSFKILYWEKDTENRYHRIALELITILEEASQLRELTLISFHGDDMVEYCTGETTAKLELVLQSLVLLHPQDHAHAAKPESLLCPRLRSLTLEDGFLRFPTILHRVYRERAALATNVESKLEPFTLTLKRVGCRSVLIPDPDSKGLKVHPYHIEFSTFEGTSKDQDGNPVGLDGLIEVTGLGRADEFQEIRGCLILDARSKE